MDGKRFDVLTKSLREQRDRRGMLGALAALPVGGGLTWLGLAESEARPKGKNRRARNRRQSGKNKQNRKGKHQGNAGAKDQAACERVLTAAGCSQVFDGASTVWSCAENTNLEGAVLSDCNLIGARLTRVRLNNAVLTGSILNNAHLEGAQFHEALFNKADLVQVHAQQANFGGVRHWGNADLRDGDFTGASFNSCWFNATKLQGANFQDADLRGVSWPSATCPDGHFTFFPYDTCCSHLNGRTTPYC